MKIVWKETEASYSKTRGRGDESKLIAYSSVRSRVEGKEPDLALIVVIPESLMRAASLRIGDRIKFVESDDMVAILRDPEGSHQLGARCGNGDSKKKHGQAVRAQVGRKLTDAIRKVWLGSAETREEKALTGDGWVGIPKAKG